MLDFDSLAAERAKSLNEREELWRNALWGADFQMVAQGMSDGEVEILVRSCPSLVHFQAVVKYLSQSPNAKVASPFDALRAAAQSCGCTLNEWIADLHKLGVGKY